MSKYAQVVTSFERTGNFPLEADYIFPTEEALKQYYSDEILAATLHKGLLKIVENDGTGKQALYWVTKNTTTDKLEFTKLVAGDSLNDIQTELNDLIAKLDKEIEDRKTADTAIWGTDDPSDVDPDYNSIIDLAVQLKALKEKVDGFVADKDDLKNQLKKIVGTLDDDMAAYMDTLPYHSITEIVEALDNFLNKKPTDPDSTDEIDTLQEIKDFLNGFTNKDTLQSILDALWKKIEGDPLPSKEFLTLKGIEDYIKEYKANNDILQGKLLEEMNNAEKGIGLNVDGTFSPDAETNYLKDATSVMNALKTLDSLLHQYITSKTPTVRNEDEVVYLKLTQELDSYVLSAISKMSTQAGNQLIKNTDGLYHHAHTEYKDGILTFNVNGEIISQHYIGLNAIVESAEYNADNEELVFVFKLQNGDKQTVRIPVDALIREWEPDNTYPDKVVELTREVVKAGGADKLSADVRLSEKPRNILVKDGNSLLVDGTTDNITYNDQTLTEVIKSLQKTDSDTSDALNKEIDRAKAAEQANREAITTESQRAIGVEAQLRNDLTAETTRATGVEADLQKQITNNKADADNTAKSLADEIERAKKAESDNKDAITAEVQRAKAAETQIANDLNAEINRSTTKDDDLQKQIDSNKANITQNKKDIQANSAAITAETQRATTAEQDLDNKITTETTRATAEEKRLNDLIDKNAKDIKAESDRATTAENSIVGDLNTEVARSTEQDTKHSADIAKLQNDLTAETQRATAKEDDLQKQINDNKANDNTVAEDLKKEIERAKAAEQANTKLITDEVTRATNAEQTLDAKIDNEITRATAKEAALDHRIDDEQARAEAAEKILTDKNTEQDTKLADHDTKITANKDSIAKNTADIGKINDRLDAHDAHLTAVDKDLKDIDTVLNNHTTVIDQHTTQIADNTAKIAKNASDIEAIKETNAKQQTSIDDHEKRISTLENNNTNNSDSITALDKRLTTAEGKVDNHETRLTAAETNIVNQGKELATNTNNIAAHEKRITDNEKKIADNTTGIANEINARKDADTALSAQIEAEKNRATTEENKISAALQNEIERAKQAETTTSAAVGKLADKIDAEITRSTGKDTELENRINSIHHPEYAVVKQGTPDSGYLATYYVTKDNAQAGQKINIPNPTSASQTAGNQILNKTDGLFMKVSSTYENGVLKLFVNDALIETHNLGLATIIADGYYDTNTKSIVMVFNKQDNTQQTIRIPVQSLIQEWKPNNEGHTVKLERTVANSGPDTITGDVIIAPSIQHNILQSSKDGVFVKGTADNITANSGNNVQYEIDTINTELAKKAPIDSPIFTGVAQVATAPEKTDSSQRIANTAWVIERITELSPPQWIEVEPLTTTKTD